MDNESLPVWGLPPGHFLHEIRNARYRWAVRIATTSAQFQQQVIISEDVGKKDAIHNTQWHSQVLELVGLGRILADGRDVRTPQSAAAGTRGPSPGSHLCLSSPR